MAAKAGGDKKSSWMPLLRVLAGFGAVLVIGALLFVPAFAPWLLRFEQWTSDWRTAYLSPQLAAPHPKVAIVTITDTTLRDYVSSPIDRGLLARIVRAVDAAGPTAIGLDVFFLKKTDPSKDQSLVAALKEAKANVVLGAWEEREPGQIEAFQKEFQSAFLGEIGRPAGYLNLRHERDNIVRYTAAPIDNSKWPKSFARLLAETGGSTADDHSRPISWLLEPKGMPSAFAIIPAHDLLADPDLGVRLKDRIVLIGGDFPLRDRHSVPLSVRLGQQIPGVQIHAHIVAGMLDPSLQVRELKPDWVRVLLVGIAMAGFVLGWLLSHSTFVGLLGWSFATGALAVVDAFCFRELNLLLPFTLAAVAWVCGLTAGRFLGAELGTKPSHDEPENAT